MKKHIGFILMHDDTVYSLELTELIVHIIHVLMFPHPLVVIS